jgi:divalent metal cation (Fe/Co/Zn/Cd) transporter
VFGFYHGLLFVPLITFGLMFKKTKIKTYRWGFPKWKTLGEMLLTFSLVTFGLVIFRAESLNQAVEYIKGLFSSTLFTISQGINVPFTLPVLSVIVTVIIEWWGRDDQYAIEKIGITWHKFLRLLFYYAILFSIIAFAGHKERFIYFQF